MAQRNYFEVRSRVYTNCLVCKLIVHQVPKLQLSYHYANPVRLWREDRSRVEHYVCSFVLVGLLYTKLTGQPVPKFQQRPSLITAHSRAAPYARVSHLARGDTVILHCHWLPLAVIP
jgi:hypothetical protein